MTAAKLENKPVSICGEMASDPLALIILLALEFDSISVHASILPKIKWQIRQLSLQQCKIWYRTIKGYEQGSVIKSYLQEAIKSSVAG